MKKIHKKKPKPTSNQGIARANPQNKHTGTVHTPPQLPRSERLRSLGSGTWGTWKAFWAFAGPLMASTTFYSFLAPNIMIEPSVNLNPSQPLATQFVISNRGHLSVLDVRFSCEFRGHNVHGGSLTLDPSSSLAPVPELKPNASVTRNCAVESSDVHIPDIIVTVDYKWPLIGLPSSQSSHFSIRKGTPGFFLVPGSP